ncbi:hypothetical protein [Hymenobacter sublimis]|uniref:Uncharacterized protein n=1 Tax=Hymenobacter sublimis TaxID=2933777 RepID=A0ABY4J7D7_9BACT|nr:hypothetical protein [Hymenobacter sublimis]UPL48525.1 hypothetical protein MWH26_15195 [Hymenobacter sublimis]
MIDKSRSVTAQQEPIVWTGDLSDDCLARWCGLLLRAEWMEEEYWWWCVYDMQAENEPQIASSNDYEGEWTSGEQARAEAENVARRYLAAMV